MYITPYMLGYANWYSRKITREILFFIPFMQVLLIGPVVYFYTKSLLNISFKLKRKDYLHFLPAILYGIYSLVVFVTDKLILDEFYFYADGRDKDLANWYQSLGLISMTIYLFMSLKHYANYKKLVFEKVSYAESILFKWIRNFMVAFIVLLILRVLFFILNPEWGEFGSQFWYYILFSLVFFYIAINGYTNSVKQTIIDSIRVNHFNVFNEGDKNDKNESNNKKVILNQEELIFWKEKLSNLMMTNEVYKDPRLTLSDVSNKLDINSKMVSSIVNNGFNMNFNDFVNHFRVQALKTKLDNKEHINTTLLGLAFDCGFNSKTTFNRAFKKSTTISPKDYLKNIPEN